MREKKDKRKENDDYDSKRILGWYQKGKKTKKRKKEKKSDDNPMYVTHPSLMKPRERETIMGLLVV